MSDITKKLDTAALAQLNERIAAMKQEELKSQYQDLARDLAQQRIHVKSMRKITGTDYMQVIILYHQRTRNYYKSAKPMPGQRPDCASPDGITGFGDNGTGKGQHACMDCPLSKWGSSTKGEGKGMACRLMRFVALHRLDPRNEATPQVEIMQIAPTNLRSFATFLEEFIKKQQLYFSAKVGVHLQTDDDGNGIGFDFEIGDPLSPEELLAALDMHEAEKASMQKFLQQAVEQGTLETSTGHDEGKAPKLIG